jgi:hypothetical protein
VAAEVAVVAEAVTMEMARALPTRIVTLDSPVARILRAKRIGFTEAKQTQVRSMKPRFVTHYESRF